MGWGDRDARMTVAAEVGGVRRGRRYVSRVRRERWECDCRRRRMERGATVAAGEAGGRSGK